MGTPGPVHLALPSRSHFLPHQFRSGYHVTKRRQHLLPTAGLEATIRVEPNLGDIDPRGDIGARLGSHGLHAGDDGRVNVVNAGPNIAAVAIGCQRLDHLVARAGILDRQNVRVQGVDGTEDLLCIEGEREEDEESYGGEFKCKFVLRDMCVSFTLSLPFFSSHALTLTEVRVAEMRHDLARRRGHTRGETEGSRSPLEVCRLAVRLKREPFADGGIIDLRLRARVSAKTKKKGNEEGEEGGRGRT